MKSSNENDTSAIPNDYYSEYVKFRGPTKFSVPLQDFYHRRMLALARPHFPGNPSILEVGFGLGNFAQQVRRSKIDYAAVDMSPAICAVARKLGFEITHSAFPPIPASAKFNVIWMSHVLEHARDWHAAREMASAAFEGLPTPGTFVVICPDIHSFREYFWMDWSHGYATSAPRLSQLMHDVGFEDVSVKYSTFTVTNRPFRVLLDLMFYFVPVGILDGALGFVGLRPYCSSFMTLFGWRHLVVIAKR